MAKKTETAKAADETLRQSTAEGVNAGETLRQGAVGDENSGAEAEYKKVFIRRPADERNVKAKIVGINGKMYAVPYDKEVGVPPEVAEVLEASAAAREQADEIIDALGDKVLALGGV